MELEWDEAKRRSNLRKHGLDFDDAKFLDWDNATVIEDTRFTYPEPRYWAFARWNGRLHMVAFCMRGDRVRIISFRKANDREAKRYGKG
jgi:uncharacterized DUF497 family protein